MSQDLQHSTEPDRHTTHHESCGCQPRHSAASGQARGEADGTLRSELRRVIRWELSSAEPSSYLDAAVYGAMTVIQPELDRHIAGSEALRSMYDTASDGRQQAWDQLARIATVCGDTDPEITQVDRLVEREMNKLRAERDEWRDRYHRMHSEMDKEHARAEHAERQRDHARSRLDESRGIARDLRQRLDAAQSEATEYRQAAEAEADLEDESQASVRRLRDERGALRSYLTAIAAILGEDSSDPNRIVRAARGAVSERDRLDELADERDSELNRERREREEWERNAEDAEQRCANAEREQDQLQDRIDRVVSMCIPRSHLPHIREIRDELTPGQPADDGEDESQYAPWYCDCDSPDPCTCPDTAATAAPSRCVCRGCTHGEQSDVAAAQHQGYVHGYRDGRTASATAADAENESPPFQPGDWVREPITETPSQVQDVRLGRGDTWIVRTDRGEEPAPTLEPWQPRQGERVTGRQLCGAGVGPHVTGRYQHEPDGPDTVVTDSAVIPVVHYTLRPAEGGDD